MGGAPPRVSACRRRDEDDRTRTLLTARTPAWGPSPDCGDLGRSAVRSRGASATTCPACLLRVEVRGAAGGRNARGLEAFGASDHNDRS
jgi:hypothetical protein